MIDNPYEPSTSYADQLSEGKNPKSGFVSQDDLRRIAQYQRGIRFNLLIHLLCYILIPLVAVALGSDGLGFVSIAMLGIFVSGFAGTVFVFLLVNKVYGIGGAIALVLGSFFPCLGLFFFFIIDQKAASILERNGIKVGLFGAEYTDI